MLLLFICLLSPFLYDTHTHTFGEWLFLWVSAPILFFFIAGRSLVVIAAR